MKYLEIRKERASGELTIKGTRIRIATAIIRLAHGWTIEELHESWPHIPLATIRGALDEAAEHLSSKSHAESIL